MKKAVFRSWMVLALAALSASGADIVLPGSPADQHLGLDSSQQPVLQSVNSATLLTGDDSFPYGKGDCAAILVFQLPELDGEEIAAANLSVYWEVDYPAGAGAGHPGSADTSVPKWCDVYALRTSSSDAVLTTDYGFKSAIGDGDVLIQEQFLYAASNVTMDPVKAETNALADAKLAAWLNARFDAGAQAGDFVFLRIHGQFDTGNPFTISSANAANTVQRPELTLTTGTLPPVAAFNAAPLSGTAPLTVEFNDLSVGDITNRFWDFGDGTTTLAALTTLQHTYTTAGIYTVSLTVSGEAGSDSVTQSDLISVAAPVPPSANFSASTTTGRAPLTVTFTDSSTGSITNRIWDFGDGTTTSTLQTSIQHTYTTAGTFTVSLTCDGPAGSDTDTRPGLIVAGEPLLPGLTEIFGHPADCTIGIDSTGAPCLDWPGHPTIQCADDHFRYGRGESAAVLVFELPDIGTETITWASLSVVFEADYIQSASAAYPADGTLPKSAALYGLRHASGSSVLTTDYGFRDNIPSGNTLIQQQYLVQPASRNAVPTPAGNSAAGRIALGEWIQSQYNAGAMPGDYIFLRIHADSDSFSPFRLASADSLNPPVLLISTADNASETPSIPMVSLNYSAQSDPENGVIHWTTDQGRGHVYSILFSPDLQSDFQPLEVNLPDSIQSWPVPISGPSIFYIIQAQ